MRKWLFSYFKYLANTVFILGKQSQVFFTTKYTKLNLKEMTDNGNSYTFGAFLSGQIIKNNNKHVFIQMACNFFLSTQDINTYLYVFWIFNNKIFEMMISRKGTFLDIQFRVLV